MAKKEITSRQMQAQETKQRVFEAATEVMTAKGYDNATIQEICEKANVSVGTFYNYFASKEDIIVEVYKQVDEYFEELVETNQLHSTNMLDRALEIVYHQLKYAYDFGPDDVTQAYKAQIQAGNKFFVSTQRSLPRILKEVIEEGQAKGEIRSDLTADEIATWVLVFSRGLIYDWCTHSGSYDLLEIGMRGVEHVIKGFLTPK